MPPPRPTPDEARQALLAEAERIAGMGSWVWDVRSEQQEWSENLYRLLGFEPGSVVPGLEVFHGVIHPEDRARVQREMAQSAEDESAPNHPVEYRAVLADGSIRTLVTRAIAVRDEQGELIRLVGTVMDQTEAIRQREERRRSREILELSQQIARIGSWVWDPATDTTVSSKECLRILGEQDAFGMEWFLERVHPEDVPAVLGLREEVYAKGEAGPELFRFARTEGEARHVEIQARAMGDDPRTSPHVGILHDVTERVRLEQQLQLSRTLEATGRLAAGVAHDFNNLLMVVLNNALELGEERSDERVDQIVAAAESGAEMVRRLLTFGRQAADAPQSLELSETLRDMAGWLSRLVGDEVTLELQLPSEPLHVRADAAQLHQVLLNLAANARDAMPHGGALRLEALADGDNAVIRMHDEGIGMNEATQRRAFDPFFTTKEVGDGTGLGLSMAYGVITRLGGTLRLWSEEGHGTRVEIAFPRLAEPDAVAAVPQQAPATPKQHTILLVEDEPSVRYVTTRMLEREGHLVLAASGPEEALQRLAEVRPDLVLTDLAMPDGGGMRVAHALAEAHDGVPIVFMTGYAPEDGALPGPTLNKPFRPDDLYRRVREALGES